MSPSSNEHRSNATFHDAVSEYHRRIRDGETVSIEALIDEYPEIAPSLREYFRLQAQAETVANDGTSTDPDATTDQNAAHAADYDRSQAQRAAQIAAKGGFPRPFGRYRLEKTLGRGAMGVVYLATDLQVRRQVAIKTPQFDTDVSPAELARFYREARAAATLQHPGICPVFDVGELNGEHYIAMAFIRGKSLDTFTSASKQQNTRQVARLVRKLATALQEAHHHKIVHRDLKPANIMIDDRGEPIIMDFGLARLVADQSESITRSGALLGTPAYMSPEQVSGNNDQVGPQSDIFSLGIIFYELLAGSRPFTGDLISIIRQIASSDPTPPSELRADVHPRLESICMKMLAKPVSERYASMQDVADALTETLDSTVRLDRSRVKSPQPEAQSNQRDSSAQGSDLQADANSQPTDDPGFTHPLAVTIREPDRQTIRRTRSQRHRRRVVIGIVLALLVVVVAVVLAMRDNEPVAPERRAADPMGESESIDEPQAEPPLQSRITSAMLTSLG